MEPGSLVTTGDHPPPIARPGVTQGGQLAAHTGSPVWPVAAQTSRGPCLAIHEYFYTLAPLASSLTGHLANDVSSAQSTFCPSATHHTQHQLGKNKENV